MTQPCAWTWVHAPHRWDITGLDGPRWQEKLCPGVGEAHGEESPAPKRPKGTSNDRS
jgi:hypothetical protein